MSDKRLLNLHLQIITNRMKQIFSAIFIFGTISFANAQATKKLVKKAPVKKIAHETPKAEEPRKDNFAVMETQEVRFKGTDEELVTYFMQNIKFDSSSIKANAEGEVMLSFVVNFDSTVVNPSVVHKFGYNVDDQMIELVKKLKFVPAKMNGVLTRSNHMISIPLRAYAHE
jgi:hypothetical protein